MTVAGPEYLGAVAFGGVWATGGHGALGSLYRLSPDSSRVLSQTGFDGASPAEHGPVQVGDSIALLAADNHAFTFFNQSGHMVGSLPELGHGAITGYLTGGWAATKFNQVARLDPTGHVMRRLNLAVTSIDGLAISPDVLWVIDAANNQLVRVQTSTGAVTGRVHLRATTESSPTSMVGCMWRVLGTTGYVASTRPR